MKQNKPMIYGVIGAIAGGVLVWFFAVNANSRNFIGRLGVMRDTDFDDVSTTSSLNMMGNDIDAHFIEQMIPHHEDAITMAELAKTQAKSPELKKLAMSIINSQGKEIIQMKSWYQDWYDRQLPTGDEVMNQHGMMGNSSGMHMGMMGDSSDMTRLEQATDFDKTFVEEMIPHHQMAVMMASMLKNGTDRPEMKQLADDIILAQTSEIELMRSWLSEWNK